MSSPTLSMALARLHASVANAKADKYGPHLLAIEPEVVTALCKLAEAADLVEREAFEREGRVSPRAVLAIRDARTALARALDCGKAGGQP